MFTDILKLSELSKKDEIESIIKRIEKDYSSYFTTVDDQKEFKLIINDFYTKYLPSRQYYIKYIIKFL